MADNLVRIQQNNLTRKTPSTYLYLPPDVVAALGFMKGELVRVRAAGTDAAVIERVTITPVSKHKVA